MFVGMNHYIYTNLVQQHRVGHIQRVHRSQTRWFSRNFYIELCYTWERKVRFCWKNSTESTL